jgi:hypothetical protein
LLLYRDVFLVTNPNPEATKKLSAFGQLLAYPLKIPRISGIVCARKWE